MTDSSPRPWLKRMLHLLRRTHLYLGLFLFPWAILYGVSAFLFNHPEVFSEQPMRYFGPEALRGTPLESIPTPTEQAEQLVRLLNEKQKPITPYTLGVGPVKYNREFAFATVKAHGQTVNVLFDVKNGGGTVRSMPDLPKTESTKAPFATAAGSSSGIQSTAPERIVLPFPLPDRINEAVPTILERTGFPGGKVTVTSVPELVFPIVADGTTWTASYHATTGSISGVPTGAEQSRELSWRRFVLRLHTTHGYPGERNARWYWALLVDATAVVFCFWGLSGLVMWWQMKSTRIAGVVVLVLSALLATALGVAMYETFVGL